MSKSNYYVEGGGLYYYPLRSMTEVEIQVNRLHHVMGCYQVNVFKKNKNEWVKHFESKMPFWTGEEHRMEPYREPPLIMDTIISNCVDQLGGDEFLTDPKWDDDDGMWREYKRAAERMAKAEGEEFLKNET